MIIDVLPNHIKTNKGQFISKVDLSFTYYKEIENDTPRS
jgi:hypothetical protein